MEKQRITKNEILKKFIGIMLVIAMIFTGLPIVNYDMSVDTLAADIEIEDGKTIYTIGGGMTPAPWAPMDDANVMTETEIEGVYKIDLIMPAYNEESPWQSRFGICAYNDDTLAMWARILLGEPEVSKLNNNEYAYEALTQIRVACEEETPVTVYFDSSTYAVVIRDSEGKNVPYTFGWITFDDMEVYCSPEEFSAFSVDTYKDSLVYEWTKDIPDRLNITKLPNIVELNNILNSKLDGTYVEPMDVTYHFYNAKGWENVGAWIKQSVDWSEDCLPLDKCILKDKTNEPIWPGAKMEEEGNGWYKITCTYTAPQKGSCMIFNNYVGDTEPTYTVSEADLQKLKDAGVVCDTSKKQQTSNISIKKGALTSNEYWINWDGNINTVIAFGKSDLFTDTPPSNYNPGYKCNLVANESSEDQTILKDEFLILEVQDEDGGDEEYTYKYVMEDVATGEVTVLKKYSTSTTFIHLLSETGIKKFTVYAKNSSGGITVSNSITINVKEFSAELIVNRNSPNHKLLKGEYILLEPKVANESEDYLYKYVMEDVATGKTKVLKDYSASTRHIELLDTIGTKNFKVYVKNSETEIVTNTVSIEVIEEEKLSAVLKVNGSKDKVTVTAGDTLNINAEASGGNGCYAYKYALYNVGTNKWTVLSDFSDKEQYVYVPETEGTYQIALTVKDTEDDTVVSAERVSVEVKKKALPLAGTLKVNGSTENMTVNPGDKLTLKVDATGGSEKYTYKYALYDVKTGVWTILKDNSTNSEYVYQVMREGTYQFALTLKDSTGKTIALNRVTVKVEKKSEPLTATTSINGSSDKLTVNRGTKVTLKTNASGGSGNYTYKIAVLNVDTGKWSVLRDFGSSSEYIYALNYPGTKQFAVTVKDGAGNMVAANRITVVVK